MDIDTTFFHMAKNDVFAYIKYQCQFRCVFLVGSGEGAASVSGKDDDTVCLPHLPGCQPGSPDRAAPSVYLPRRGLSVQQQKQQQQQQANSAQNLSKTGEGSEVEKQPALRQTLRRSGPVAVVCLEPHRDVRSSTVSCRSFVLLLVLLLLMSCCGPTGGLLL
uniref:Uncharacterized protein n=1 Tax=Anopheles farauti TaxID=69004 RepID=A0A182QLX7_9DIPT